MAPDREIFGFNTAGGRGLTSTLAADGASGFVTGIWLFTNGFKFGAASAWSMTVGGDP